MPSFTSILSLAALAALAQAITITKPNQRTIWDSSKDFTIEWTSVSTDPQSIDIRLSHLNGQPSTNELLFPKVDVSKGSIVVSRLQLPNGDAYRIDFTKPDTQEQIYAQSNQFNVTGQAAGATSTLEGYTGPTATPSSSSTSSSSSDDESSTSSGTALTTTSSGASATTTLSTSTTGTKTATTTGSSSGTAAANVSTSGTASGTAGAATTTPNAAAGVVASAPIAAMVFGVAALFI